MSPKREAGSLWCAVKKVGATASSVLAVLALGSVLGGWAWSALQRPVKEERAAREVAIAQLLRAQEVTNETLVELVTVMVAPEDIRLRTMRRLQAKYEIGVTR